MLRVLHFLCTLSLFCFLVPSTCQPVPSLFSSHFPLTSEMFIGKTQLRPQESGTNFCQTFLLFFPFSMMPSSIRPPPSVLSSSIFPLKIITLHCFSPKKGHGKFSHLRRTPRIKRSWETLIQGSDSFFLNSSKCLNKYFQIYRKGVKIVQ